MQAYRYGLGETVRLVADPSREGAVTAQLSSIGGECRYRVFHNIGDTQEYFQSQLELAIVHQEMQSIGEQILSESSLSASEFLANLTAARLSHPLTNTLYSFYSARIQHIPHQFKPVLRILRSDRPRLLIADEVGVGKTIEAGLILRELSARSPLDNILIVCPKALVGKWRQEMRRFDEDFQILSAAQLKHCISETHYDGQWPQQYKRAIVSLQALQRADLLHALIPRQSTPGLLELEPPPVFDLLIVDEAHHVRNDQALGHAAIRFLCEHSEAVVLLSATPVHLKAGNLFVLLKLLRPDLFPDESVFLDSIEPNQYLTRAAIYARHPDSANLWESKVFEQLMLAAQTSWGRKVLSRDSVFQYWTERLGAPTSLSNEDRVVLIRDLEELHTLAHTMNRTRRRDIAAFTIRDPKTVSVPFTETQQVFYDKLLEFRHAVLSEAHGAQVARLVLDTLERQATSCLPALVPTLDRILSVHAIDSQDLHDSIDDDSEPERLSGDLEQLARSIRDLAASLPNEDPKLNRLMEIVNDVLASSGPGKILVFSFFLQTLAFLEASLHERGCRVATITGQVPDEERDRLRERFRLDRGHPEAIDVLLSSEVGCEGLDYEFCDCLINYDIPWNPMRLEQRIGRIDRYGQKSPKVHIFNFITPGTVEERIYFRCFDRLGIFRDTVGDMEEVLGDLVSELNRLSSASRLTVDESDRRARQLADNVLREREESRRLERERGDLLALDGFQDDAKDRAAQTEKFVTQEELINLLRHFVADRSSGKLLPSRKAPGVFHLNLPLADREEIASKIRATGMGDRAVIDTVRTLMGTSNVVEVTFDPEVAASHRSLSFITPLHPLIKMASDARADHDRPYTARLAIADTAAPPGKYLFSCNLWTEVSASPSTELVSMAWDLESRQPSGIESPTLLAMLLSASTNTALQFVPPSELNSAQKLLNEELYQLRLVRLKALRERNELVLSRRRAALETHFSSRIALLESNVDAASESRTRNIHVGRLQRARTEFERRSKELDTHRQSDITVQPLAYGLLEITNAI